MSMMAVVAMSTTLLLVGCAGGEDGGTSPASAQLPSTAPAPGSDTPAPGTAGAVPASPTGAPATRTPSASALPASASASPPPSALSSERPGTASVHQSVVVTIPQGGSAAGAGRATATPVSGTGEAAAASDVPYVPEESIDRVDKRIFVTLGNERIYIRNGGKVELADGLAVEFYLDPYPPTSLHSVMDVYLTQDGEPVTDASVDVEFDMMSMAHGPFVSAAKDIGGGHHLVTLDYIMFGPWDQVVTVYHGLDRIHIPVVIVAAT